MEKKLYHVKSNAFLLVDSIDISFMYDFLSSFGKSQQKDIKEKFEHAGFYHTEIYKYYTSIKYSVIVILCILIFIFSPSQISMFIFFAIAFCSVVILPDFYLYRRRISITKMYRQQLPFLIDISVVCIQTGMTIENTINYLSKEFMSFNEVLAIQLNLTSQQAEVKGIDMALTELSDRVAAPEMRAFCLILKQNILYGTSISEVLTELSEDIRKNQVLSMEEAIGGLAAKMSVPLILFIMFPIVILILAPGLMRLMSSGGI